MGPQALMGRRAALLRQGLAHHGAVTGTTATHADMRVLQVAEQVPAAVMLNFLQTI